MAVSFKEYIVIGMCPSILPFPSKVCTRQPVFVGILKLCERTGGCESRQAFEHPVVSQTSILAFEHLQNSQPFIRSPFRTTFSSRVVFEGQAISARGQLVRCGVPYVCPGSCQICLRAPIGRSKRTTYQQSTRASVTTLIRFSCLTQCHLFRTL